MNLIPTTRALLFRTEDKVTQRTLGHYPDDHVEGNIVFKYAYGLLISRLVCRSIISFGSWSL